MPSIFCIGMFKNEADIIESFIRYHSYIFDGIVLLDNGSTDNSVKIAKKLQEEGLPVYLKEDSTIEYDQGEKTTELLYYTLNKFDPDFIFPLDLDEFLAAPGYSFNPKDIVSKLDGNNTLYYIQRQHYQPFVSDNYDEVFVPKRIKYAQDTVDMDPKVVISKNIAKKYSPEIYMGNHGLFMDKTNIKQVISSSLKLAHYQYRSLEHVKSKFLVGWLNNLTRYKYINGQARHWKLAYDSIKENPDVTLEQIIGNPQCFEAPINLSFCSSLEMKYTSKNEINSLKNLLSYCEILAKEYAKLKKEKNYLDDL